MDRSSEFRGFQTQRSPREAERSSNTVQKLRGSWCHFCDVNPQTSAAQLGPQSHPALVSLRSWNPVFIPGRWPGDKACWAAG